MVFAGFSKNCLDVLIVLYFQNLSIFPIISIVWPVIFCLNLNEALLLLSGKSIIPQAAFKARSSL